MSIHIGLVPLKSDHTKSYSMLADLFLLFSNSTPWLILNSLRREGMTLSEISKRLGMTQKEFLPELTAMRRQDILVSFNKSREAYYRLADDHILHAFDRIQEISERRIKQAEPKIPEPKTSRISQKCGHESTKG